MRDGARLAPYEAEMLPKLLERIERERHLTTDQKFLLGDGIVDVGDGLMCTDSLEYAVFEVKPNARGNASERESAWRHCCSNHYLEILRPRQFCSLQFFSIYSIEDSEEFAIP